jgi:hypothetical protein
LLIFYLPVAEGAVVLHGWLIQQLTVALTDSMVALVVEVVPTTLAAHLADQEFQVTETTAVFHILLVAAVAAAVLVLWVRQEQYPLVAREALVLPVS